MKVKMKLLVFIGCWFGCSFAFGQLPKYEHRQELKNITEQWHKISLPLSVLDRSNPDLSDIRIYGLTENDTLEAPYVLNIGSGKHTKQKVDFNLLNTVSNANGFYYTYEIPTTESINELELEFDTDNFNWMVDLEGSQNQNDWFRILEDYRILSIKTGQTDYQHTTLTFPSSQYKYYRLLIKSHKSPKLTRTKLNLDSSLKAIYDSYPVTFMNIDQKDKKTIIDIDLNQSLPLSFLRLNLKETVDYYRPVTVKYVQDSIQTEKGLKYRYKELYRGTLTSIDTTGFKFNSTKAQKLRVIIENNDNRPLQVEGANIKGYRHELIARFDDKAKYYLAYGNKKARAPKYDIINIASQIPDDAPLLALGKVEHTPKAKKTNRALLENKLWLWMVMGFVIVVLGWFTLRMMAKR
ncbi:MULTISPECIES: DUF3999 family protein [Zobellia]|uniref:DUF3999 family protein n=1 Tax=Zobellia galactanivorans (strain DSM 12802 / CCUG 47099 / CIP 106680 / NCIMB 13871 / Dsij) TaxID=63186 RepID=G0KZP9_ZOBGA|nr:MULTISPECIES: DUF3999 family protein [Zobellia]MBU3025124.1 DUF3999 family protein [Zobellia galactanivorans]OWW25286.1 hypothetical protein B4Q04_12185 [Zobellia sp. OII3]CAZ97108.1 Conserved hypothetical protein [Zobellia galactanivorans]